MNARLAGTAAAVLTSLALGSAPALADSIDIDLTGWQAVGSFEDPDNTQVFIDLGVGSIVTGFDYIDLAFESFEDSYRSEFTLSVNNSSGSEFMDYSPSLLDSPGVVGPVSGSWSETEGFGSAPFTLTDGTLWVTVYEGFDDPGVVDAVVSQGTLRVFYDVAPIPEPATYALMAFGLAAVGAAARRRKA